MASTTRRLAAILAAASGVARVVQLGRLERIRLWQPNIAESAHKLLRVDRPDAADHPGAEIPISLKIRKAGNQQKRPFPLFCTLLKPQGLARVAAAGIAIAELVDDQVLG